MKNRLPDKTIMPDGRRLISWRREISRLRAKEKLLLEKEAWISNWAKVRRILEFHHFYEQSTGDIVIRVKRNKRLENCSPEIQPEDCEVSVEGETDR